MNEVDPRERLEPFAALIGDWSTETTHPAFGDTVVPGRARFEWVAGERFLIQRAETDHPEFSDSISVIGVMEGDKDLSMQYFDSRGVHRLYRIESTVRSCGSGATRQGSHSASPRNLAPTARPWKVSGSSTKTTRAFVTTWRSGTADRPK